MHLFFATVMPNSSSSEILSPNTAATFIPQSRKGSIELTTLKVSIIPMLPSSPDTSTIIPRAFSEQASSSITLKNDLIADMSISPEKVYSQMDFPDTARLIIKQPSHLPAHSGTRNSSRNRLPSTLVLSATAHIKTGSFLREAAHTVKIYSQLYFNAPKGPMCVNSA